MAFTKLESLVLGESVKIRNDSHYFGHFVFVLNAIGDFFTKSRFHEFFKNINSEKMAAFNLQKFEYLKCRLFPRIEHLTTFCQVPKLFFGYKQY